MAVNGNSVIFTVGKETEYGKSVEPEKRFEVSSESFKYVANKTEEGLLTGRIGGGMVETMSVKADGSFSTLAKPESVGYFLKGVFGVETKQEGEAGNLKYKHTFTPIGNKETDLLPSYTFTIDRGLNKSFCYSGVVFDSVSFSAAAEDRLKLDITCVGQKELKKDSLSNTGLTAEKAKSFKFHQGTVKMNGSKLADITSISFEYKNNTSNYQSTDTGLYFSRSVQGKRECSATVEATYTNDIEKIREEKFKSDDIVRIETSFEDNEGNIISFIIPNGQIQSMENPTSTGTDLLKQSITVQAVDLETPFVEVDLFNDYPNEY